MTVYELIGNGPEVHPVIEETSWYSIRKNGALEYLYSTREAAEVKLNELTFMEKIGIEVEDALVEGS